MIEKMRECRTCLRRQPVAFFYYKMKDHTRCQRCSEIETARVVKRRAKLKAKTGSPISKKTRLYFNKYNAESYARNRDYWRLLQWAAHCTPDPKTNTCERCGSVPERLQRWYPDYSTPLIHNFVCPPCHVLLRRQDRRTELDRYNEVQVAINWLNSLPRGKRNFRKA